VLAGLPASTQTPLQRVQNAAARLNFHLIPSDHLTASFLQLHWLPVHYKITYKLCTIMSAIHHNQCPGAWLGLSHRLRTIQRELAYVRQTTIYTRFQDCGLSLASEGSLTLDQSQGTLPEQICCENNFSS
jgi:hypothetical protein